MTTVLDLYRQATQSPIERVIQEVIYERWMQVQKWGVQNHPDGTDARLFHREADSYRTMCDTKAELGCLTWSDILLEEVYEALAEEDPLRLEAELVQVAAVCTAWIEASRRRRAA